MAFIGGDGDGGAAVEDLEQAVLSAGGLVIRYGQLYGPGTASTLTKPLIARRSSSTSRAGR
ncbi:MAG TPA: hypothetical protein VK988_02320 [Acidimicrobiales bacterium]|nr:hypothetical protein [Acidimicrobiales bacterium]